jgi:hypothetical protein
MIRNIFVFILFLCFFNVFSQYKTMEECKKNLEIEKTIIVKNKITRIEAIQYFKSDKWYASNKSVYFFNSSGQLIKHEIIGIDRNGNEQKKWSGKYIYNSAGIIDSLPTDKGPMYKPTDPLALYPTCYQHLGNKKLKDGLSVKTKNAGKVIYYFKFD